MRCLVTIGLIAVLRAHAAASCEDQLADCVPGGHRKNDCYAEWLVANPGNPVPSVTRGFTEQRCVDGDPTCDFDGPGNGTCAFHVGLCLGGTDARLPLCVATPITGYTIKPAPDAIKAVDAAAGQAIVALLQAQFPGASVGGTHHNVVTLAAPANGACTAGSATITVPLKKGRAGKLRLRGSALPLGATRGATDSLKLVCLPLPAGPPVVRSVGPSMISNATDFPIEIEGAGFAPGALLTVTDTSGVAITTVPTTYINEHLLGARIPQGFPVPAGISREIGVSIVKPVPGGGLSASNLLVGQCAAAPQPPAGQCLTVFDDIDFTNPNAAATSPDGSKVYVTSQQTDEVWIYDTVAQAFSGAIAVGDNPFHVETLDLGGGGGREWVVNRFSDVLSIIDPATDAVVGTVPAARMNQEVEFNHAHTRAYVTNQNLDAVLVYDIAGGNLDAPVLLATVPVGINPRGMAISPDDAKLYVANIQSEDVSVVDTATNAVVRTILTLPGQPIVGGRAAGWEPYVISGRAPRGIVFSAATGDVLVASIGPQTGPRPGVQQIGGAIIGPTITVIDAATDTVVGHVALNGLDPVQPTCTDPEQMAVDDARHLLYVTCQGSGVVDVLDTDLLHGGNAAEVQQLPLPLAPGAPTLAIPAAVTGPYGDGGQKVCAATTGSPGAACTQDADCGSCANQLGGAAVCCGTNNPTGLHNGPRGIAISPDRNTLYIVNQFTTSLATVDTSGAPGTAAVARTVVHGSGGFVQQQRRLGQIEFFSDLKKTNISCATCHIDDHQDAVFFEADVVGPRLRRVLSVRQTRDMDPLLQDQLIPDLLSFTDIVVHVERGGNTCFPRTRQTPFFGTCNLTSDSENDANTVYAEAISNFPNPNVTAAGGFELAVPLPDGTTGNAVRGARLFDTLACATCHPDPLYTIDQFGAAKTLTFPPLSTRLRNVGTPPFIPLRARCQDPTRAAPQICVGGPQDGVDCTTSAECPKGTCQLGQPIGVSVPTLRGIWDTFPLLQSGAAGFTVVGSEPSFTPSCTQGSNGCCTELLSPVTPLGHAFTGQHLEVNARDPIMAVLTTQNPTGQHGGDLSTLSPQQLRDLDAFLRSL
jgi:YVTN family beta-propeller protein